MGFRLASGSTDGRADAHLLVADFASAAVLLIVPIAAWTDVLTMPMLLVAALLAGTAGIFSNVAFNAFLPHLVAREDLMEGNAKLQTSSSVALVVGPGLGGLVAQAAGAVNGIVIDSFTFLVSAACLLGLRPEPEPRPSPGDRPGMLRQIAEGIRFIMRGRLLQAMLVVAAVTNFAMLGITALRVVFLVRAEGAAPGTAGLVIGAASLGGILGAVLASGVSRRFGSARTYLVANAATAPFVLLLPVGGHGLGLALFAAGSFVVLVGSTMANVMTMTFRGNFVPAHLLGRVTAASRIFVFGSIPLGATTAGFLASAFGTRAAMWALAVLYVITPCPCSPHRPARCATSRPSLLPDDDLDPAHRDSRRAGELQRDRAALAEATPLDCPVRRRRDRVPALAGVGVAARRGRWGHAGDRMWGVTTIVRLETAVDLDVPEHNSFHDVDSGQQDQPVPSGRARPGRRPGPRPTGDPRQVSVTATLSAVLDDGRRIMLLDDRGWGSTQHWDAATVEEIEDTARTVVGPDEPIEGQTHEEVAAAHWAHLTTLLGTQGVIAAAGALQSLPHDVVLSERLRARVRRS